MAMLLEKIPSFYYPVKGKYLPNKEQKTRTQTVLKSPTEARSLASDDQLHPRISFAFDFNVFVKFPSSSRSQTLSVESCDTDTRRRLPSDANPRSVIIPEWSISSNFKQPTQQDTIETTSCDMYSTSS